MILSLICYEHVDPTTRTTLDAALSPLPAGWDSIGIGVFVLDRERIVHDLDNCDGGKDDSFFSERKRRRRCMYIKFEIILHGGVILNTSNIFLFLHLMSAND